MSRARPQHVIAAYTHEAASDTQTPDERPGAYYVSVFDPEGNNGAGRRALLAGPWPTHREALDMVAAVRAKACELNDRGHWYAYGTARLPDDDSVPLRYGSLNKQLGLPA